MTNPRTERQPPSVSQVLLISVLAASATSALVTYGLRTLDGAPAATGPAESPAVESGDPVDVPNLVEMRSEAAGELVRGRGLRLVVTETEASELAEGVVVRQSPVAGTLQPSEAVEVVLSSGPEMIRVPELSGRPVAVAQAAAEALGLVVEVDETAEGDTPGSVMSTSPAAGMEVAAGSTVQLHATPAGIEVPELVGTPYRRARGTLEEAGLALGRVRRRYDERRPEMIVVSQEPEAGARVPAGTEIAIVIND